MLREDKKAATFELPTDLGRQSWRCQGLRDWGDVALLGKGNVEALVSFAELQANHALASGDRDEANNVRETLEQLRAIAQEQTRQRPLLPRLRRENFRRGERVLVYIGDIPGADDRWVNGSITTIDKSYKTDWRRLEPNSGYYWRISAQLDEPSAGLAEVLPFSTSEPRVLPMHEVAWLREQRAAPSRFMQIFAANAKRKWPPLWCQELALKPLAQRQDPAHWYALLADGRGAVASGDAAGQELGRRVGRGSGSINEACYFAARW